MALSKPSTSLSNIESRGKPARRGEGGCIHTLTTQELLTGSGMHQASEWLPSAHCQIAPNVHGAQHRGLERSEAPTFGMLGLHGSA